MRRAEYQSPWRRDCPQPPEQVDPLKRAIAVADQRRQLPVVKLAGIRNLWPVVTEIGARVTNICRGIVFVREATVIVRGRAVIVRDMVNDVLDKIIAALNEVISIHA